MLSTEHCFDIITTLMPTMGTTKLMPSMRVKIAMTMIKIYLCSFGHHVISVIGYWLDMY